MHEIGTYLALYRVSREKTLGLLQKIQAEPEPMQVLGYRPGPGRAHIAWQLLHIGVTEELFATERLFPGARAGYQDLIPRFRGNSTPDDQIPSMQLIEEVLAGSRAHLEAALTGFQPDDLDRMPPPLVERGWTLRTALQVLAWHEAHHQGQAHLTFNLWKNRP